MSNDRYHDDIALLADAVRIPSVSTHEAAVAQFLVAQMAQRGLRSYVDKVGNAVGQIGDRGPEIMLLGHIDTVPGDIPVTIRDGNLYGRGTVDAKGPFVAANQVGGNGSRWATKGACCSTSVPPKAAPTVPVPNHRRPSVAWPSGNASNTTVPSTTNTSRCCLTRFCQRSARLVRGVMG